MPVRTKFKSIGWVAFCKFADGTKGFSQMMQAKDEKDFTEKLSSCTWQSRPIKYLCYYKIHSITSWINCACMQTGDNVDAKADNERTGRSARPISARQRGAHRSKVQR